MKICGKCNIEKPFEDFVFREKVNRYESRCNECVKEYHKEYYDKNKQKLIERSNSYYKENTEKVLSTVKEYREKNKEKVKKRKVNYHIKNAEKIREKVRNWRNDNKEKRNTGERERRKNDILHKLVHYLRSRTNSYIKKIGVKKNNSSLKLIGMSPIQLKEHLEKQFTQDMSWDNYGFYGWHIDHIIPLSSAKTEEEIYKLCHYSNLQPLWAEDNLKKSNKILVKKVI
jgi:hypothetical protein